MANEIGAGVAPEINTKSMDEIDFSNADAAKAAYQKMIESNQDLSENNKQLFARAKKAEGFDLDNGEWIKREKAEPAPTRKPSKNESSTPNELDYGQLAFYNTKSSVQKIESVDDVDFLRQTIAETGKSQDAILGSNWFQSELKERMSARESANAIPTSAQRSGQSAVTDFDIALAKFQETGELPGDFETRSKVVNETLAREEKNKMFSGPSVIGPRGTEY